MNRNPATVDVGTRVAQLVHERFGAVEERLMEDGVVDSTGAIELAFALEDEFGIDADDLTIRDMRTLTSIVERVEELAPDPP